MIDRKLLFMMKPEQLMAFLRLQQDAESGDGAAAGLLGDMSREGLGGVTSSSKETFRWYSRSALAGDPNGQNNLGACYEHGLGCAQSYPKAVKWYRLATAQGLGTAAVNLGYCCLRGHGIPADKVEALKLFRLAVERGEDRAAKEVERLERDRDVVRVMGLSRRPRPASVAACPGGHAVDPATLRSRLHCGPADSSVSRRSSRCDSPLEARSQLLLRDGPPAHLRHSRVASTESRPATPGRESRTAERPFELSGAMEGRDGQRSTGKDGRPRIRYVHGTEAGKNFWLGGVAGVAPPVRELTPRAEDGCQHD